MNRPTLFASLFCLAALSACASAPKADKSADAAQPTPVAAAAPDNSKQPVQVGTGAIVSAKPAQVWALLTDVDQWGAWNPKITKVSATPGFNAGTEITYSWEEKELKAVVEELKEPELLVWRGTRHAADAKLRWMLYGVPAGTSVNVFAVLKPGAGATPQANAFNEADAWLKALAAEANKRYPATAAPAKAAKKAVSKP